MYEYMYEYRIFAVWSFFVFQVIGSRKSHSRSRSMSHESQSSCDGPHAPPAGHNSSSPASAKRYEKGIVWEFDAAP